MMAATRKDPYDWQGIAAALQQDPNAFAPTDYYDINADPYGVASYMTPQLPGQVSDAKWNFGQPLVDDIDTMSKRGNALQDYYQVLSNPVVQWLNMATTGNASLDLESLLGGGSGGIAPYVTSLASSDDQYLQTIGQQLMSGASPETIKLQMRQVPELADNEDKLKIYDAAADNGWKAVTEQKATGPDAQFEKLGLTSPLKTYTHEDLPPDVRADKNMLNRWFGGAAMDEPKQWNDYHDWYREAAEALRRQNAELQDRLGDVPVTTGDEAVANMAKTAAGKGGRNPVAGEGGAYYAGGGTKYSPGGQKQNPSNKGWIEMRQDPAQMSIDANNRKIKDYEGRLKEAQQYLKGPKRASLDDIEAGVNKIRAYELTKQGRTPARDQARSMLSWLSAQNYG